MSCSVVIPRPDRSPLGDRDVVMRAISDAIPGVQYYREPSGPEKIAIMRERGIEFPEVIRLHLEQQPAALMGDFEGDEFSMRFYLGSKPQINTLLVELGGKPNGRIRFWTDWPGRWAGSSKGNKPGSGRGLGLTGSIRSLDLVYQIWKTKPHQGGGGWDGLRRRT